MKNQPNNRRLLLFLLTSLAAIACGVSGIGGGGDIAPQSLNIQGNYDWFDGFGNPTACIVRVYWQDGAWRGWVRTNHESPEICPWDGYEVPRVRTRGDRIRMAISCPRSGCPTAQRLNTAYLLDVVPGVMLSGRSVGAGMAVRWRDIRLVRRDDF